MKLHFKGLDTLRAIAALVVVVSHIELLKARNGIPKLIQIPYLCFPDEHLAVMLFFILSGFLITYLLMKEQENTGAISFKKFYLRRIFRIWPVYYFVIILSQVLFNPQHQLKTIVLCLGIFPNVASALDVEWTASPQIWSIGVEEQFYLFWPLIIYLIPKKRMVLYLSVFFVAYTLLPHLIKYINALIFQNSILDNFTNRFFYQSKFNCMSLGGIFGYLYAMKRKELNFFYKDIIAYPAIILSFILWFSGFKTKNFNDVIYSLLFVIMIINLATNKNLKLQIDNKIFSFLGRISYGIYMYHWIVILLLIRVLPYQVFGSSWLYNLALYSSSILLTILVSHLSFISFEKYFLQKKEKYDAA